MSNKRPTVASVAKEVAGLKKELAELREFKRLATETLDVVTNTVFTQDPEESSVQAIRQYERAGGQGKVADAAVKVLARDLQCSEDKARDFAKGVVSAKRAE